MWVAPVSTNRLVFDTVPTGHTLRLLKLPAAWTGFIDTNTTGSSCLGPLAGLEGKIGLYRDSLSALSNHNLTTVVLVTRPEASALTEAARTSAELADLGVGNQRLIVNGFFTAQDRSDAVGRALEARGQDALRDLPARLAGLPRTDVPLLAREPIGIDGWITAYVRTNRGGKHHEEDVRARREYGAAAPDQLSC